MRKKAKQATRHQRCFIGLWVDETIKRQLKAVAKDDRRPLATVVLLMIEQALAARENGDQGR